VFKEKLFAADCQNSDTYIQISISAISLFHTASFNFATSEGLFLWFQRIYLVFLFSRASKYSGFISFSTSLITAKPITSFWLIFFTVFISFLKKLNENRIPTSVGMTLKRFFRQPTSGVLSGCVVLNLLKRELELITL